MIILDTNIIIELFKGNLQILQKLKSFHKDFAISSITLMELFYGAHNKKEVNELEKFLSSFSLLHITTDISKSATQLVKTYAKSHTLDIPDSLIAATALSHDATLFTLNTKDFTYIPNIKLL